jgi:ABC-2 type transport system permease protein
MSFMGRGLGPPAPVGVQGAKPSGLFGPGSSLWLLRHDLRLAGRDLRSAGGRKRRALGIILVTSLVLLHLIGFTTAPMLARLHDEHRTELLLTGSFALAGVFTLFLSKAISEATDALFQRGDLDLLLSSPIPMRRVLTTRLAAIAVTAAFLPIVLVVPVLNGMVLRGRFEWAGGYAVLASLSLAAAAAGAAVTFGLLASVGPRWTRIAARALATVFGAFSFFATQARVVVPAGIRARVWEALVPTDSATAVGPQWWPARAVLGDALPIFALAVLALAAVVLVSWALGQAYGSGVMSNLAVPRAANAAGVQRRFGGSLFSVLVRKEWRLLVRHPGLGAQVFYQFVFLVPGAVALMNLGETGWHSAAGVVFLTAMMTGRITKILVAGPFEADQAAALAVTSPVAPGPVFRAKVLVTSLVLAVVGGLPVVAIGLKMPAAFPAACIASAAAASTRMWLAVSRPKQLRRAGMQGRLQPSTDGLLGVMIDIGWGVLGAVLTLFL